MPNEFVIKNGYISKGNSIVEGGLTVTTISATTYSNLPSSPITIGTTPISSGTDGRVFFQAGGVVQQSPQFTFEEASNAGILRVRELGNIIYDLDARTAAIFNKPIDATGNSIFRIATGGAGTFTVRDAVTSTSNAQILTTSVGSLMDFNGGGIRRVRIDSRAGEATLQIRAAGVLSTDIAFRVRNSTDTANLIESRGNGHLIVANSNFADVFTAQNSLESFRVGGGNLNYVRTTQSGNLTFVIRNGASSNALITFNAGAGNSVFWENLFGFDTTTKNVTVFGGSAIAGGNSGDSVMWVRSGTSTPSTSFADMFGLYSADITAGNAAPHFRTENGSIVKLYQNANTVAIDDVLVNVGLRASGGISNFSNSISATTISATTFNLSGSQLDTLWTSYTPTWTAASSNPSIGDGTIEGYYKLIGKTCFVRGNIAMGSTTTFGSGEWYVELPFPAKHADGILMTANLLDNGTAWYNATLNGARAGFNTKTPIQYQGGTGTALDVNATQPFTWANSDRFIWNGSYEIL